MDRIVGRSRLGGIVLAGRGSVLAILVVLALLLAGSAAAEGRVLWIAMTNAQKDSGIIDVLLPEFVAKSGYAVRVVAREIGAVAVRARKGEVDVIFADSPGLEEALVAEGVAVRRTPFMESRYVIVGPKTDPAGVARVAKPEAALGQIVRLHMPFVSRFDESSAHLRERELLRAAGLDPDGRLDGVFRTGTSMRDSLRVASERHAYLLADLGTFLTLKNEVELVALSKPAPALGVVHSILQLDPTRFERTLEIEGAKALEQFLLSPESQARIAAFGVDRFGEAPFAPRGRP